MIVFMWILEQATSGLPLPAFVLRLVRLIKTLRLLRLTRSVEFADTLNLMVVAMRAGMSATVWSLCLVSMITTLVALCLNYGFKQYVENTAVDAARREEVFEYFGTFWRSLVTVAELTFGNWVPVTRLLQEYLGGWLAAILLAYRLIMDFAVLKVVAGVFLHETFKVAKTDSELMIRGTLRERKLFKDKITELFAEIDNNHDGTLSRAEFMHVFDHPRASLYLGALGLEYGDAEALWSMVLTEVDGDGKEKSDITIPELEHCLKRIRGASRSLDVIMALQKIDRLSQVVLQDNDELMRANRLARKITLSEATKKKWKIHGEPGSESDHASERSGNL
jgi:hypothetical protein